MSGAMDWAGRGPRGDLGGDGCSKFHIWDNCQLFLSLESWGMDGKYIIMDSRSKRSNKSPLDLERIDYVVFSVKSFTSSGS